MWERVNIYAEASLEGRKALTESLGAVVTVGE